jgi:hypothetical protein
VNQIVKLLGEPPQALDGACNGLLPCRVFGG